MNASLSGQHQAIVFRPTTNRNDLTQLISSGVTDKGGKGSSLPPPGKLM